jgi:DNA-binding Lrp family transcriptional regulator
MIISDKINETLIDNTDLKIINSLSRDGRVSYRNIASTIGITSNAVKKRIQKLSSKGVIQSFVVRVNPVLLGYDKECFLTIKHIDKGVSEEDIVKKLNLIGDVQVYAKQMGRASICALAVRVGAEDKIRLMKELLEPSIVESRFVSYKPVSMKIHSSDFKIIKSLLSNPRMQVEDIARETSLSTKTVARRLEKLRENHVVEFGIIRNISSIQLVGYIEFAVLIDVDKSLFQSILERIYYEMREYLLFILNMNQNEFIFAVLSSTNIPTVDLILARLESYEGVKQIEPYMTTKLVYYQEWLQREIDKRLRSEQLATTRKKGNFIELHS